MSNRPSKRPQTSTPASNGAAQASRAHAGRAAIPAGLAFQLDPAALEPLITQVVEATVARLEADRATLGGKIAFTEPEAAALVSLHPHQLRDERRRGRIAASIGPGRKVLYSRQDLLDYLAARRWESV